MEKRTINQVLHTGGWFWYRGKVTTRYTAYEYVEEVIFVPDPKNQNAPDYWVIPYQGEWLSPWAFPGEWWGPIIPPWETTKEEIYNPSNHVLPYEPEDLGDDVNREGE